MLHDMFNMTIGVISTVVDCQKMSVFELLGDLLANAQKKKKFSGESAFHFRYNSYGYDKTMK